MASKEESIKFHRRITKIGDSMAITIPRPIVDFMGFDAKRQVIITAFVGKKGKFMAIWLDEDRNNDKNEQEKEEVQKRKIIEPIVE